MTDTAAAAATTASGGDDFFFFGVVLWSYLFVLGNFSWNCARANIIDAGLNWRIVDHLPNGETRGGDAKIERKYILRER